MSQHQVTGASHPTTSARPSAFLTRSPSAGNGRDDERTYDELYEEARKRGLKGRSKMSKTELERALAL
jgi:hypothetical protein